MFVLVVDNFGIKYLQKRHAEHLLTALQTSYKITTDWSGTKCAGMDLHWDYTKQHVAHLLWQNWPQKSRALSSPPLWVFYGAKQKIANDDTNNAPKFDAAGITCWTSPWRVCT